MTKKSPTVTFNAGGKILMVSRSLIDQDADTMLARLVSDTRQSDPEEAVFIDRDGDIFGQVLNYLRYGSVVLPRTVSKEMFLRDMDYYGIVAEEGSVLEQNESVVMKAVNLQKCKKKKEIKEKEEELKDIENRALLLELAARCHQLYIRKSYDASEANTFSVEILQDPEGANEDKARLYDTAKLLHDSNEHRPLFDSCLSVYGLALDGQLVYRHNDFWGNGKTVGSYYVGLPIKYTNDVSGNTGKQE